MEAHANGHTYLHPRDRYAASANILTSITVEEVNAVAKELCEHLSHMDVSKGVMPAAVVACAPVMDRSGALPLSFDIIWFCNFSLFNVSWCRAIFS